MDKGRAHNGPLSAQGLRDLFEPSGRARDAQTLDKTRKIVYARRHAFSFPFQPETRWLMSRSFTEIITLMQRGAGRFADDGYLRRLMRDAEVIELVDSPARKKPLTRRVRGAPFGGSDVVVILPPNRGLPDRDGTLAYNVAMTFPTRGETLVLCLGSESSDPYWFGLKAYVEWVRHLHVKEALDTSRSIPRRARAEKMVETNLLCGELVAKALDDELNRALSKLAPRQPPRYSKRNDRELVIRLTDVAHAEVERRFPKAASDVEEAIREHLISTAVCFAARGALGLKVA
jgi:hypothetical protein